MNHEAVCNYKGFPGSHRTVLQYFWSHLRKAHFGQNQNFKEWYPSLVVWLCNQCCHTIQGRVSTGCLTCTMDPLYTSGLHDYSQACECVFLQTSHAKPPSLIRLHNVQYPLEMFMCRPGPGQYGYYCTVVVFFETNRIQLEIFQYILLVA